MQLNKVHFNCQAVECKSTFGHIRLCGEVDLVCTQHWTLTLSGVIYLDRKSGLGAEQSFICFMN